MRKYRKRNPFTESDKAEMWDRWLQGDSVHAIARLLGASHTSVRRHLLATGGIRPARRHRSTLALSLSEREEISRGIVAGHSIRCIARTVGRAPSPISRELHRNGGRQRYRACQADQAAWHRALRPKRCKLVANRALAGIVAAKLRSLWSP